MLVLIYIVAVLLLIAGVLLLIRPALILGFMDKYSASTGLYIGATLSRLLLGGLLLYYAGLSRYPLAVSIIGGIAVAAAGVFLGIGKTRFQQLLQWIMIRVRPWVRAGGVAALLLGSFLLYAFV